MSTKVADKRFMWLATAILLLAAATRLALLTGVPPGLSQDEVLNADIVKFILAGEHAIFFRHGFGHEALYHYLAVPFQVLLGDNSLAIRLPSVFLGLVLVALTMRWARRDFGRITALVAGLGLAVSWWAIIFSRVGIRPILEPVLLVATVWAWPRKPWLAGVLLGLSIYSYTAARYIFLLPLFMLLYLLLFHRRGQSLRPSDSGSWRSIRSALIVFLVSLVFYIPLALTLRADPTLQQRVDQLSGPLDALGRGDLEPVLSMTAATLGVFTFQGDPRWTYSLPGRPLFDPITSIFFLLGVAIVIWRWRRPRYALLLFWSGLALLPSALSPDAPSTIRLIGLLPVAYLMLGISASWLWCRWQSWLARTGSGKPYWRLAPWLLLFLLVCLNLGRTIDDGFISWPAATDTRLKYQSVLGEMADYWQEQGTPALVLADSYFEPIDADSFRRTLGAESDARWVQAGKSVTGALVVPGQAGPASLYVPEFAPLPPILLEAIGVNSTPVFRSNNSPSFAVYELEGGAIRPLDQTDIVFDQKVRFLGYDLLEANEQEIRLISYWRVEDTLPADLAAFVHLVGEGGEIVAQDDGLDAAPQTLRPGDVLVQLHVLPLQGVLTDGPLALQIGLYRRLSQSRLTHAGSETDRVTLEDELFLTKE